MILDIRSRDDSDVMIHKYLIIILMSYNIGYSESMINYMSYVTILYYYMFI